MKGDALVYGVILAILLAGIAGVSSLAWLTVGGMVCHGSTSGMTIPHRFRFIGGCQVKTRDGWVPLKNYRAL